MWADARYQTRHVFVHNTAVTLTGGAADVVQVPVVHDKIEILAVGLVGTAAFPGSGTMTTKPVVSLDKIPVDASGRVELGTVTPDYSALIYTAKETSLDAGASNTPIAGPANYPTAVKGDQLVLEHKTQGVGGTQTAKLYFIYREVEA